MGCANYLPPLCLNNAEAVRIAFSIFYLSLREFISDSMNTNLDILPERKREDLRKLTDLVLEALPATKLIVLFGSYARGTWAENDVRHDFNIETVFSSDYDILVVTSQIDSATAEYRLDEVQKVFHRSSPKDTPAVQFLQECVSTFTNYIHEARYFYTDILDDGLLLYKSVGYKIPVAGKLNYAEQCRQAKEYYKVWYRKGRGFLRTTYFQLLMREYALASFMLHQATESFYHAIELVFTLKKPRQHDLYELLASTKKHSELLACVFPLNTDEDKRLFDLLKRAYIESRYNPKFKITRKDIRALLPKVRLLKKITRKICQEKIRSLEETR